MIESLSDLNDASAPLKPRDGLGSRTIRPRDQTAFRVEQDQKIGALGHVTPQGVSNCPRVPSAKQCFELRNGRYGTGGRTQPLNSLRFGSRDAQAAILKFLFNAVVDEGVRK